MGYTHYWYQPKNKPIAPDVWALIVSDVQKVLNEASAILLREYDEPGTKPEVTADLIAFNGVGNAGHETFYFERAPKQPDYQSKKPEIFNSCKTANKSYDTVVCACLIIIAHHAGDAVLVKSDGDINDWAPGLNIARSVTGSNFAIPIKDR